MLSTLSFTLIVEAIEFTRHEPEKKFVVHIVHVAQLQSVDYTWRTQSLESRHKFSSVYRKFVMLITSQLKEKKTIMQVSRHSKMFTIYKTNKEQPNFQKEKNKEKMEIYMHFKVWQISIHGIVLQFKTNMFALNIGNAKHAQNGSRWFLAKLCKGQKRCKKTSETSVKAGLHGFLHNCAWPKKVQKDRWNQRESWVAWFLAQLCMAEKSAKRQVKPAWKLGWMVSCTTVQGQQRCKKTRETSAGQSSLGGF